MPMRITGTITFPFTAAQRVRVPGKFSTCYDNGNTANAAAAYSLGTAANGGTGGNCALSFRFQ